MSTARVRLAASKDPVLKQGVVNVGSEGLDSAPSSASIIINNYNYARFLRETIESALAQSAPAQVIVVDDGSTDDSWSIIQSFGDRVQAILKENGGQASAINLGFAVATGDIVIFLDSDDVLEPVAIAELLKHWRPGTVMTHYPMTIIDREGRTTGVHPNPPDSLDEGDVVPQLLATGKFRSTVTSGIAFSRAALSRVMPMPEPEYRCAVDGYLMRCMAFLGSVQRLDARLARYRMHGTNSSNVAASPYGIAAGCRKRIIIRKNEFAVVRKQAELHGRHAAPGLGETDAYYLGIRLFSLLLAPGEHPVPEDRRTNLLRRYVAARWHSPGAASTKLFAIALAGTAALMPRRFATTPIQWLNDPTSRPEWLRLLARRHLRGT